MKRVLVVDDSPVVQAMARMILSEIGCQMSFVSNGAEALRDVATHGEPGLILLDVNMPVMDGLECLDELRARGITERVPVILVTTEGRPEDVARGLKAGAREYVTKPFNPVALRATIRKLLTTSVANT